MGWGWKRPAPAPPETSSPGSGRGWGSAGRQGAAGSQRPGVPGYPDPGPSCRAVRALSPLALSPQGCRGSRDLPGTSATQFPQPSRLPLALAAITPRDGLGPRRGAPAQGGSEEEEPENNAELAPEDTYPQTSAHFPANLST
ncbi:hypothetical protein MC885_020096 [Smutsia gigantea]|nr:hypothetical protein MC885_020096 [Smutsia gigantea]